MALKFRKVLRWGGIATAWAMGGALFLGGGLVLVFMVWAYSGGYVYL